MSAATLPRGFFFLTLVGAYMTLPAHGQPPTPQTKGPVASDERLIRKPTEQELKDFLKPIPGLSPQEALKTFETVDGFRMELVAAEPLVYSPVAAAFDEDGNLYVAEMRDYPYKPQPGKLPIGRVRLLKDTDGDGVFDKAFVFADQLLWAAGIVPWKGGVFVTAPPDIWYLRTRTATARRTFAARSTLVSRPRPTAYAQQSAMGTRPRNLRFDVQQRRRIRPGDQPSRRPSPDRPPRFPL